MYVPKNDVTDDFPPILIEIQNCVNQKFLTRLIRNCTHVYDRYNAFPVVLVFEVKGFSNVLFEQKFDVNPSRKFLLKMQSKCWAKSCYFVSSKSIQETIPQNPRDPIGAVEYYMSSQP